METNRCLKLKPKKRVNMLFSLLYKTNKYKLNKDQEKAIIEILTEGAGFAVLGVGSGKTLLSFLLTYIFDLPTLLLCPADLRNNADIEFAKFRKHFNIAMPDICSYGQLSVSNFSNYLDKNKPKLIICDEAHKLKSLSSVRTKRLFNYLLENPSTKFIGMTGTVTAKSLHDYAHLFEAALGDRSPIPRDGEDLIIWDEHIAPSDLPNRWQWIELSGLANKYGYKLEGTNKDKKLTIQKAYREHLVNSSGVHFSTKPSIGSSLVLFAKKNIGYPQKLKDLEKEIRASKCLPNGEVFPNDAAESRSLFQIAHGFYYIWDWHGIADHIRFDWTYARSDWNRGLRAYLSGKYQKNLDAPSLVEQRIKNGGHDIPKWLIQSFKSWEKVRDKANPSTIPIWIDDYLINYALNYCLGSNPIILWYKFKACADKLRPYIKVYEAGQDIDLKKHHCALSLSYATGHNLQSWDDNFFLTPMRSGLIWEQALGRTHRQGQASDIVRAAIPQHHTKFVDRLASAIQEAKYIQETTGNLQKLCYASWGDITKRSNKRKKIWQNQKS